MQCIWYYFMAIGSYNITLYKSRHLQRPLLIPTTPLVFTLTVVLPFLYVSFEAFFL